MSFTLKEIYSREFYIQFCQILNSQISSFDQDRFLALIFDTRWQDRELKDRLRHTTTVLHHFLPSDFPTASKCILQLIEQLKKSNLKEKSLEFMFFPDYIEQYGLNHFNESVQALEEITQFTSAEFAVRPFIKKYPKEMIQQMLQWSAHPSPHVRRLASEGSRPRLPWAMALPALKKDPAPALPILENLRQDTSEYVRRSVANHLNDISKDNPQVTLKIAQRWKGLSKETDRIIKHACRTLLKQGHSRTLQLFDYSDVKDIYIQNFSIQTPLVKEGEDLLFQFQMCNQSAETKKLRIEYGLDYMKANHKHARKVFKITENTYAPHSTIDFQRKQSFKRITTRKFYAGVHHLALLVNGEEFDKKSFNLEIEN